MNFSIDDLVLEAPLMEQTQIPSHYINTYDAEKEEESEKPLINPESEVLQKFNNVLDETIKNNVLRTPYTPHFKSSEEEERIKIFGLCNLSLSFLLYDIKARTS